MNDLEPEAPELQDILKLLQDQVDSLKLDNVELKLLSHKPKE